MSSPPASTAAPAYAPAVPDPLFAASVQRFLGPVVPFLADPTISEILINGPTHIYIERGGQIEPTDARFASEADLAAAVRNVAQFAGRHLDDDTVRLDARLPDGSRVHVVRPPCSRQGTVVAIRKFARRLFDLQKLVELGTLTPSAAEFLGLCVLLRKNLLVAGGTGTGKTSLLNAISTCIPAQERILVIEDSSELQLQQPHVLSFEARLPDPRGRGGVTIRDLFVSSLRLRPDRIVIGEVRGGEAIDLLQAMTSGHPGSMSTLHADSPADALRRLETMSLMAAVELPHHAVRAQVAAGIHVVVQATRFADGSRRIVEIGEVAGLDAQDRYQVAAIYRFRHAGVGATGGISGALEPTGHVPGFAGQLAEAGWLPRVRASRAVWGLERGAGGGDGTAGEPQDG